MMVPTRPRPHLIISQTRFTLGTLLDELQEPQRIHRLLATLLGEARRHLQQAKRLLATQCKPTVIAITAIRGAEGVQHRRSGGTTRQPVPRGKASRF